jgi:hypothetical protein
MAHIDRTMSGLLGSLAIPATQLMQSPTAKPLCTTMKKLPNLPSDSEKRVPHRATKSRMLEGRKRVRFEEQRNKIIAREASKSGLEESWYNHTEYRSFQVDARRTMMAFSNVGNDPTLLDESLHCLRGLEKHQFPPHARALYKYQNRQFIRLIVYEHFRLRKQGIMEVEGQLQAMSSLYTVPAKAYAMHLARHSD